MRPGEKVKILLVDDHKENLLALEAILSDVGHHLVKANSGREALRHLLKDEFAVILLDVRMPGMDGFETAALIRDREKTQHVPIIFLTAFGKEEEDVLRGYALGAVDYMFKPFVPEILRAKVEVLVDLYRKTAQIRRLNQELEQRAEELEASQAELAVAKAQYFALLESTDEGIYGIDLQGHATFINKAAAALLGYRLEEVQGKNMHQLIHHSRPDGVAYPIEECPIYKAFQAGLGSHIEDEVFWRRDGTSFPAAYTSSPLRNGEAVIGAVIAFTDITERRLHEEKLHTMNVELQRRSGELEAANKELEAFSYSVSHDLRAPLRHIDGFADLLEKHIAAGLDEKGRKYLATISESAKQMGKLIDDLLAFSRAGRAEVRLSTVSLDRLVTEVLDTLKPETEGRHITWTIAPLPDVQADPALLRQVLINLIGNAVKYTRPRDPAVIEIGVAPSPSPLPPGEREKVEGEEIVIYVKDNGAGFDPAYAHKLFGVFQRLHGASEFEGTGIGLANVRRIVSRHGGRTWAEGEVDKGATFYFSLPKP